MQLDLVVLGNLIVDDIVYDDGRSRMAQPGGAAMYMALAAALWELRVGLVTIAGSDFPTERLADLERRGIHLEGVQRPGQPGLRTWLLYEGPLRRVVHRLDSATHLDASPSLDAIPSDWQPRALHQAPMPFDLQVELAAGLRSRYGDDVLYSLDPFELMSETDLPRWRELLGQVDLFFVSEDELASPEIRHDPEPFLSRLLNGRLRSILCKQGPKGGLVIRGEGETALKWSGRHDKILDTTGAGDAFASGVLAGLLRHRPLERALQWGVVSASFAIAGAGADELLQATPGAARDRLHSWFGT